MRDVLAVEVMPRYRQMAAENLTGLDNPPRRHDPPGGRTLGERTPTVPAPWTPGEGVYSRARLK